MPVKKGSQLDFEDRCVIEEMLIEKASFRSIAKTLGVSPTTISHEVKSNRFFFFPKRMRATPSSRCNKYRNCGVIDLCEKCTSSVSVCKHCKEFDCYRICKEHEPLICKKLNKAPFVCVVCQKRGQCTFKQARYRASTAQLAHDKRLRDAHIGISVSERDLEKMVDTVKRLLSQGQSLEAIWINHANEFPVGVRTFYNYIDKGVLGLANIDLPKKVKYAPRKKRKPDEPKCNFEERTYKDWLDLDETQRLLTVQMDTIEGLKTNSQCILSLHFIRLFFQLFILLPNKTQVSVKNALDAVEVYCEGRFQECFPIILTDRGSEFLNPELIETSITGDKRTRVYYCDPVKPGQKGSAEKNHVEFRKILPKGSDFDTLEFGDISLVCSHVNSYPRAGVGAAPIKMARVLLPPNLLESLGIEEIDADLVVMTPNLLK